MQAGLCRRVGELPARARDRAPDAGFTLTEVLVSLMLIGVVMGALTTFYVQSMAIMNHQRARQAAIQLAADGIDLVRSLKAPELATATAGGPAAGTTSCVNPAPVTNLDAHGLGLAEWRHDCPPNAGIPYNRYWYVGKCWQSTDGGDCTTTPGTVTFWLVVVAVTWHDKACAASDCTYTTSTLVNADSDPLFEPAATTPPPVVAAIGDQRGEVDVPVTPVTATATGGAQPVTFSATGLPDGLSMSPNGTISGTPIEAGAFTQVTATASDDYGSTGSSPSFTWTIAPLPRLANPGTQTATKGTVTKFDLTTILTGGTAPYTWSVAKPGPWGATGLPPGLKLDPSSGVVSGTPRRTGPARNVTATVTDRYGKSASATFGWTVVPRITTLLGPRTDPRFTPVLQSATADGSGPYTWTYTNLPEGVTMTSGGLIAGDLLFGARYLTTVIVTDATGATNSVTFPWSVNGSLLDPLLAGLEITAPTGDRVDRAGQTVDVPVSAMGWSGTQTWSVTGLPPGVTMANGALTGTPAQAGTYLVTLEVRVPVTFTSNGHSFLEDHATFMFTWTIR